MGLPNICLFKVDVSPLWCVWITSPKADSHIHLWLPHNSGKWFLWAITSFQYIFLYKYAWQKRKTKKQNTHIVSLGGFCTDQNPCQFADCMFPVYSVYFLKSSCFIYCNTYIFHDQSNFSNISVEVFLTWNTWFIPYHCNFSCHF